MGAGGGEGGMDRDRPRKKCGPVIFTHIGLFSLKILTAVLSFYKEGLGKSIFGPLGSFFFARERGSKGTLSVPRTCNSKIKFAIGAFSFSS